MNRKKTRNCIELWRSVQFEASGGITPCCSGTLTGNFGNINIDYFERIRRGEDSDLFANADYLSMRKGLLTGDLHPSCISCRSVHDDDITIEELRQRVVNHLESQGVSTDGLDLTKAYAFTECGGNITNKCNFSCVYCAHSGVNGHTGYFLNEMDRERFLDFIDLLCSKGLRIFNFCGIGELTIYPGWKELCDCILERHPQLRLRMISNFGKRFHDAELQTLSRFDLIHVSCDTLDETTFAWLRKGGSLPLLLDNIRRLREKFTGNPFKDPKLVFNTTVTNVIIDKLESLFRFAADHDMFVHISSLFVMDGSIASKTGCVTKLSEMPTFRMPHIREVLSDLPRRMKAQNPHSNVWEYKNIFKSIAERADAITFNQFVPQSGEAVYASFSESYPKDPHAYLRKIWLSFDDAIKGIYLSAGVCITIPLPLQSGTVVYRPVWCRERIDGNLDILFGRQESHAVSGELTVSAANCHNRYDYLLIEVLSYEEADISPTPNMLIEPTPPDDASPSQLVREAFLMEEEAVVQRLAESQEPIVIWCAGLKTLQLLSSTPLGMANIHMVIDGNPERRGQSFCGRTIHAPSDLGKFSGRIVVIHASSPEQVATQIRNLGIANDIITL